MQGWANGRNSHFFANLLPADFCDRNLGTRQVALRPDDRVCYSNITVSFVVVVVVVAHP